MRSEPSLLERVIRLPVRLAWSLIGLFVVVLFASFFAGFGWLVSPADHAIRFFHGFLGAVVGVLLVGVFTAQPGRIDRGALLATVAFAVVAVLASASIELVVAVAVAGAATGHDVLPD